MLSNLSTCRSIADPPVVDQTSEVQAERTNHSRSNSHLLCRTRREVSAVFHLRVVLCFVFLTTEKQFHIKYYETFQLQMSSVVDRTRERRPVLNRTGRHGTHSCRGPGREDILPGVSGQHRRDVDKNQSRRRRNGCTLRCRWRPGNENISDIFE